MSCVSNKRIVCELVALWLTLVVCFWEYFYQPALRKGQQERYLRRELRVLFFGDMGPDPSKVRAIVKPDDVVSVGTVLTSVNHRPRWSAASILGSLGPQGKRGVSALLNALHHPDDYTRRNAAESLGRIGQFPDIVIPALIECLEDENRGVQICALSSLARFGSQAKPYSRAILEATRGKEHYVREITERALKEIDPDSAVNAGVK